MAGNVLMKACCAKNLLPLRLLPNIFCSRILFSSKQSDKDSKPNQIVISQEEPISEPPSFEINWKRLKRTWMYFKQYTNFYKYNPHNDDDNNLRIRLHKKDEVIYYFRNKEDLDHWYVKLFPSFLDPMF